MVDKILKSLIPRTKAKGLVPIGQGQAMGSTRYTMQEPPGIRGDRTYAQARAT